MNRIWNVYQLYNYKNKEINTVMYVVILRTLKKMCSKQSHQGPEAN